MKAILFPDFNGTITQKDLIESIINHFAPPHWKTIHKQLIAGDIDIDIGTVYRYSSVCNRSCGVCKGYVIEKYYKNFNLKIYAGDGVTDLDACQYNDIIFSTGGLSYYLKRKNISKKVAHFETFYDIVNSLRKMERELHYEKPL